MTAIAGLIRFDGAPVDVNILERMQNLLTPYGRDAQQHWRQGGAGLLRTLLRTTAEDRFDRQPLYHDASDTRLLFDGRIDNRDELIRELGLSAADALLLADSDLALRSVLKWDVDAVRHFIGNFALACWRAREQRLWLARDPLGYRPLFWHRQPGFFAFASLAKVLLAIPGVPRAICEERLADQLLLLPTRGPESFYKNIFRVEPGQVVAVTDGRLTSFRYHAFDPAREIRLARDDDYLEAFGERLETAVHRHLRAAGPIASHLSSGYDSSTVTAVAARQRARRGQTLTAYTAVPRQGFAGPVPQGRHADESIAAAALAARFPNIQHIVIRPNADDMMESLRSTNDLMDRVVTNPCNAPWALAINEHAQRSGIKVLLGAQMGNFTISYDGDQLLPRLLGQLRLIDWLREMRALKRTQPNRRWLGLLSKSISPYLPSSAWLALSKLRDREMSPRIYSPIRADFLARMSHRIKASGWNTNSKPWSNGRKMRIAGLSIIDLGESFTYFNSFGLDFRDPTADLQLIDFCLSIPESQYLRNGTNRWLLRRFVQDILPDEILQSKTKGLQGADWYEATATALPEIRREISRMLDSGVVGEYIDLESILHALNHWPQSGWDEQRTIVAYRIKMLRGLGAGHFVQSLESANQ